MLLVSALLLDGSLGRPFVLVVPGRRRVEYIPPSRLTALRLLIDVSFRL